MRPISDMDDIISNGEQETGNQEEEKVKQETGNQEEEKVNLKRPRKGKTQQSAKKAKPSGSQVASVRCDICELDFTSKVPYDMHIQGAKHAKKMKAIDTLRVLQSQGHAEPTDIPKIFHCDVCDLSVNGALQLQTHFEGNKHKQKVQQLQKSETTDEVTETVTENGKQSLNKTQKPTEKGTEIPEDSTESAPTNKMQKLACDICNIIVNSGAQLQQHLDSKKHKAKVEGKPLPKKTWGRFKKDKKNSEEEAPNVDVPDINSSFIKEKTTETIETETTETATIETET